MKIITLFVFGLLATLSAQAAFDFSSHIAQRNDRNRSCGIEQRGSCFRYPGSRGWLCHSSAEGCYIFRTRRGCSVVCTNPVPVPGQE